MSNILSNTGADCEKYSLLKDISYGHANLCISYISQVTVYLLKYYHNYSILQNKSFILKVFYKMTLLRFCNVEMMEFILVKAFEA